MPTLPLECGRCAAQLQHLDRVLLLDRVEQPPAAVRVAGAADVLDDLDVAALDQVVVRAAGGRAAAGRPPSPGALEPPWPLPYGVIVSSTGNGPVGRLAGGRRRIDLVDADRRCRPRLVIAMSLSTRCRTRRSPAPVAAGRGAGGDDVRRELGGQADEAGGRGLHRRRAGWGRRPTRGRGRRERDRGGDSDYGGGKRTRRTGMSVWFCADHATSCPRLGQT